ncbi:MAG TPA: HK97-gp10 family putative phage morphogenesis protein [Candidatus Krumholzibacteriaceae bacterium]|jgi:HK97 gp10 family phage protein|nr:HK97-gp10 family putative phage morphogenesis protein [Candidatus Krumholzibacteriaceae bacterium]
MSVEVQMEWEGMDQMASKLQRLEGSLKSQVQQSLEDLASSIETTAKQLAPTKTGYLRSTISTQTSDWTVKVCATAPYAAFLEFGTRRIRAFRFLSRALEEHIPKLGKMLDDAVDVAVAEASRT